MTVNGSFDESSCKRSTVKTFLFFSNQVSNNWVWVIEDWIEGYIHETPDSFRANTKRYPVWYEHLKLKRQEVNL